MKLLQNPVIVIYNFVGCPPSELDPYLENSQLMSPSGRQSPSSATKLEKCQILAFQLPLQPEHGHVTWAVPVEATPWTLNPKPMTKKQKLCENLCW